jgi:hypothetical protein
MVAYSGYGWRLAPCLVALMQETDRLYPNRSEASDGSIGDSAHRQRQSDHNPSYGWVCAVDITDDKAHGCDTDRLAQQLIARRDPRVKQIIWNRMTVKSFYSNGHPAWRPYPYTGENPHYAHTHISCHNTTTARNDLRPWWSAREEFFDMDEATFRRILNEELNKLGHDGRPLDVQNEWIKSRLSALETSIKANAATIRDGLANLIRGTHGG